MGHANDSGDDSGSEEESLLLSRTLSEDPNVLMGRAATALSQQKHHRKDSTGRKGLLGIKDGSGGFIGRNSPWMSKKRHLLTSEGQEGSSRARYQSGWISSLVCSSSHNYLFKSLQPAIVRVQTVSRSPISRFQTSYCTGSLVFITLLFMSLFLCFCVIG